MLDVVVVVVVVFVKIRHCGYLARTLASSHKQVATHKRMHTRTMLLSSLRVDALSTDSVCVCVQKAGSLY